MCTLLILFAKQLPLSKTKKDLVSQLAMIALTMMSVLKADNLQFVTAFSAFLLSNNESCILPARQETRIK